MTKFEFVLNKFYEITAWSLLASVVMTLISKSDMIPASLLSDLSLGSQHDKKRVCDSHCHSLSDYEWDCAWWWRIFWMV